MKYIYAGRILQARHRAVVFDCVCFVSDPSPSIDLIWYIYIIYIYITTPYNLYITGSLLNLFALLLLTHYHHYYSLCPVPPPVSLRSTSDLSPVHLISTSTSTLKHSTMRADLLSTGHDFNNSLPTLRPKVSASYSSILCTDGLRDLPEHHRLCSCYTP